MCTIQMTMNELEGSILFNSDMCTMIGRRVNYSL